MFSDHPSPNERWLHGVSLVHMPNGGGILNTFVFICGKVSLILSFCRANVSRTSSKILGHIQQSLRFVETTHSPNLF